MMNIRTASVLIGSIVSAHIILKLFDDLEKDKLRELIKLRCEYQLLKIDYGY